MTLLHVISVLWILLAHVKHCNCSGERLWLALCFLMHLHYFFYFIKCHHIALLCGQIIYISILLFSPLFITLLIHPLCYPVIDDSGKHLHLPVSGCFTLNLGIFPLFFCGNCDSCFTVYTKRLLRYTHLNTLIVYLIVLLSLKINFLCVYPVIL